LGKTPSQDKLNGATIYLAKTLLPIYEAFKLGGPRRLSGLYLDQLTGSRYDLATLSYYRQYATLPSQIGRGLYIGGSLEAGRMNDQLMKDPDTWVRAAGIYFGADTILGEAFIGYGYSSLQQGTFYIAIGPQF
jgi:NTE family protein